VARIEADQHRLDDHRRDRQKRDQAHDEQTEPDQEPRRDADVPQPPGAANTADISRSWPTSSLIA
jgi:hypothetical protein